GWDPSPGNAGGSALDRTPNRRADRRTQRTRCGMPENRPRVPARFRVPQTGAAGRARSSGCRVNVETVSYTDGAPVRIARLAEAVEALRSPNMHKAKLPGEAPTKAGTISWLDGPAHLRQRRILNPIVSHSAHKRYLTNVLEPIVARHIDAVLCS